MKRLKHLTDLTQLENLDLYQSGHMTDAGMTHLARLNRLRLLNLADSHITDRGLQQLAGLTRLRDPWLGNAHVSQAGIDKLKQTAIDCSVTHD